MLEVNNRAGFLKKMLNPSSGGDSNSDPPSLPATTPIKEQDVDKVSRKKLNMVSIHRSL